MPIENDPKTQSWPLSLSQSLLIRHLSRVSLGMKVPVLAGAILCALLLGLTGCAGSAQAAVTGAQPTFQPTETPAPLVTPTLVPAEPPRALPVVDWADTEVFEQAMKPEFAHEVERFVDANRYVIVAELTLEPNDESYDAVIRGAQRVRYTNRSSDALDTLVFRLYANSAALGGRTNVTHVSVAGVPVEPSLAGLRSVMGVPLPAPLAPGASVELTIDFDTTMAGGLNASYGRFGYVDEVVSATGWYPTLSVYQSGEGWWDTLPHPQGDPAFTETGLYDVRLTLPSTMTVAMSGSIIERTDQGDGTVTYRDVTGPMRDHAFLASTRYMVTPAESPDGTHIQVVHYRDRAELAADGTENVVQFATQTVAIFSEVFGEYPFAELDIVMNPTSSGVEFPGLVQIAAAAWVRGEPYLEVVVVHEIGHQWFYSMVGNNQVEHPWIDESLTSYTEVIYFRAIDLTGRLADRHILGFQRDYTRFTGLGQPDLPLDLPVSRYGGYAYGSIVYRKGPLFYLELERLLGIDTVYRALAAYFDRYRFDIVETQDIQVLFEDVSGQDLQEVFEEWVLPG